MKQLLSMLALFLACTGAAVAQSADKPLYTYASLANAKGEAVFHAICQGCHMPDAKGATGAGTYPALTGNPKLASPQYMAAVILFGRHDMPSFVMRHSDPGNFFEDATLTDAQIADVINYVRTHFGNHYTNNIAAAEVAAMHPQTITAKQP
ncbi:c-type cytochrome [Dyella flagellata]|uniref:Cytochrome c6 n=1 Tax=Dyella flagellata TaxID=1867833 RepID=A0ABQ5XDW0_9GAMM|nr:cytochrome c [Dyella flagellata]GLQ88624.1 cytochrome c6 [Dyella flagellata]